MEKGEKMRILFELEHPGHFHFFKNIIQLLKNKNYEILVTVKERERMLSKLLKKNGIRYLSLSPTVQGILKKSIYLIKYDFELLKISKRFNPDIFVSMDSPYIAHVSAVMNKPHIAFEDTEDAKFVLFLAVPFTDVVITEDSHLGKLPQKKHISLHTWRPLAYLHPRYFKPNKKVLDKLNLSKDDKFFILRFSSRDASHDWGINYKETWNGRRKIIKKLEKEGTVFITSEVSLPSDLNKYRLRLEPYEFLDALYYSAGYLGEGGTTAREAVALGKPSILILSKRRKLGCLKNLEKRDFLIWRESYEEISEKDILWFLDQKSQENRVKNYIKNLIDFNKFMVWFIENYPESFNIMRENPRYQERFKWKF